MSEKMGSVCKTHIVTHNEVSDLDFIAPSRWYIVNACGEYVFIQVRERDKAQAYVDEQYGVGKYKVNTFSTIKNKGEVTVRGTNSRKGFSYKHKK